MKAAFAEGVKQQKDQRWGRALAAFNTALTGPVSARGAAAIQFNMSVCERALGRYVSARQRWLALTAQPELLDLQSLEDAQRYLRESQQLVARIGITLEPESAILLVDDLPLVPNAEGQDHFQIGFDQDAQGARSLGKRQFSVLVDPGNHIFRAKRSGHADAVVNATYREGESAELPLALQLLPATISVKSDPQGAFVKVDERAAGVTPVVFQQPAGEYRLSVERTDFDVHEQALSLQPGERIDLVVPLKHYETPLIEQWWFWAGSGALVAGATVLTYFLVRPGPETPPYDGGSSGWVVGAH